MTKNLRKRKHLKPCLIALLLPSGLGVIRINKKVLLHVGVLNTTCKIFYIISNLFVFLLAYFLFIWGIIHGRTKIWNFSLSVHLANE